jgi:succinylglutamate desuccinylase
VERLEDRVLGCLRGPEPGPTLVCVGTLHGNEPAGSLALKRVFAKLQQRGGLRSGEFVGLMGNRAALAEGKRFLGTDLNRHWSAARIHASRAGELADSSVPEDRELDELRKTLFATFSRARDTVHLLDLHTTSGLGAAFVVMSDTLRNRRFALKFPVPIIVGLEEEIEGTLTEYVGCLGHVTMAFEGGQHQDPAAVDLCEAAVWTALVTSGLLQPEEVPELEGSLQLLRRTAEGLPRVFEIRFRHPVQAGDGFRMEPGFKNFQPIEKGQLLARDDEREYYALEDGRILMPLYQKLGDDGYFEVRPFSPFWLRASSWLRRLRVDSIVHWLPGVERHPQSSDALIINRQVARFYSLQIFHLLGYRRHRSAGQRLVMTRQQRDFAVKDTCSLEAGGGPSLKAAP